MDTSETYIKMRLAAIPDLGMGIPIKCPCYCISQDVWVDSKGDWYYQTGTFNVKGENCQLERQDQLQEMAQDQYGQLDKLSPFGLCQQIYDFAGATIISQPLYSMEQLWLAFVMFQKYNKVWNGTGWILDKVLVEQ